MAEIFNFSTVEALEVRASKSFIKDEMTGRVDIVWRSLKKPNGNTFLGV